MESLGFRKSFRQLFFYLSSTENKQMLSFQSLVVFFSFRSIFSNLVCVKMDSLQTLVHNGFDVVIDKNGKLLSMQTDQKLQSRQILFASLSSQHNLNTEYLSVCTCQETVGNPCFTPDIYHNVKLVDFCFCFLLQVML